VELKECTSSATITADRVREWARASLERCSFERMHLDTVLFAMMSRITELHRAARLVLEQAPGSVVAAAVLLRSLYESFLVIAYIRTQANSEAEGNDLAKRYLNFEPYEYVEAIGDDRDAYRSGLSPEEQKNWDRRVEVHDQVKANLTPEQKRQRKPTWNGKSIRKTAIACRFDKQGHDAWYGVQCMINHASPGMIHNSVTLDGPYIILGNPQKGDERAAQWLRKANQLVVLATCFVLGMKNLDLGDHTQNLFSEVGFDPSHLTTGPVNPWNK